MSQSCGWTRGGFMQEWEGGVRDWKSSYIHESTITLITINECSSVLLTIAME
jgi:hypothetical protein